MTTKKLIMNIIGILGIFAVLTIASANFLPEVGNGTSIFTGQVAIVTYGMASFMLGVNLENYRNRYLSHKENEEK